MVLLFVMVVGVKAGCSGTRTCLWAGIASSCHQDGAGGAGTRTAFLNRPPIVGLLGSFPSFDFFPWSLVADIFKRVAFCLQLEFSLGDHFPLQC